MQWSMTDIDRITMGGPAGRHLVIYIQLDTTNRRAHAGNQVPGVNENKTTGECDKSDERLGSIAN